MPEALERGAFALQEWVVWPLQDRLAPTGAGVDRRLLAGGGAAGIAAAAAAVVLFAGGGSSPAPPTEAPVATAAQRKPLASLGDEATQAKEAPAGPTLHGAAPVFSPGSSDGEAPAVGDSKELSGGDSTAAGNDGADATGGAKADSGASASNAPGASAVNEPAAATLSSPATDTISSDPKNSRPAPTAAEARAASSPAVIPDGPPAGKEALAIARRFAKGFVVYETGGQEGAFRGSFESSATPELTKALLERPPRQPAGVKVPQAKVVNVVAGPSQGTVYKVSVSLLRVGVTSELRLDMEKSKRDGWLVTNVLG